MITCPSCGATCPEPKDTGRFTRRHPARCTSHARLNKALAAETRSVDYDERTHAYCCWDDLLHNCNRCCVCGKIRV